MRTKLSIFGSIFCVFIGALGLAPEARAASYYVSPSGSGSTCSTGSPCSLNTGIGNAQPGDEVVLKDGTYQQGIVTVRNGQSANRITIRAENRHLATLLDPTGINETVRMKHNYITLSGLIIDGNRLGDAAIYILSAYGGGGQTVVGTIIEDNRILDSGTTPLNLKGVNGATIRNNFINGTGYNAAQGGFGEAFYLSIANDAAGGWAFVTNVEIYGNTVQDTTNNVVDFKEFATNVNVHHNIFENHVLYSAHAPGGGANDGIIRSNGADGSSGNKFGNNIVRNSESLYIMRFEGNRVDVKDNVFYNITANSYLSTTDSPGAPMQIHNNTFCNTPSNYGSGVVVGDLDLVNNLFNQAQGVCDAVEQRILSEMTGIIAGEIYYAGTGGSAGNSCEQAKTEATRKLTIAQGIACLTAGDTLLVTPGTYAEVFNNTIPTGVAGSHTIIKSQIQHGAIIRPTSVSAGYGGYAVLAVSNQNYITIDGLDFNAVDIPTFTQQIIVAGTSHHVNIINNKIHEGVERHLVTPSLAVWTEHNTANVYVAGNEIYNIGTNPLSGQQYYSYGLYWHGNNGLIENNDFHHTSGYAIQAYNTIGGTGDNNVWRNNSIHHAGLVSGQHGALIVDGGASNQVYGNLFYSNGGHGVAIGGFGTATTGTLLYNNTIYGNSGGCIRLGSAYGVPSGTVVRNNICYQNSGSGNNINATTTSGTTESNNLFTGNPLFVNAAVANFRLQAGSPAIGVGFDTNPPVVLDKDGVMHNLPMEMGVYAYDGPAVVPTVLVFTNSPTTTVLNALMPLVTVCIDDTAGVRQNVTDAIALTIGTDANPTTVLAGGTGGAATTGCRAFPNVLSLNKTGTGFTLRATSGDMTKDSGPFDSIVQPAAPTELTIGRIP